MNEALWPYSQTFESLQAKFPGLSHGELAMWVSNDYLTAYPKAGDSYPFPPPEPYQSVRDFRLSKESDKYGHPNEIWPFKFREAHAIEDLRNCYFNSAEIEAFTPETCPFRYLTFQQLVERWQPRSEGGEDIRETIKKMVLSARMRARKFLENETLSPPSPPKPYFHFWAVTPIHPLNTPVEECLFRADQVEAREKEWFPGSEALFADHQVFAIEKELSWTEKSIPPPDRFRNQQLAIKPEQDPFPLPLEPPPLEETGQHSKANPEYNPLSAQSPNPKASPVISNAAPPLKRTRRDPLRDLIEEKLETLREKFQQKREPTTGEVMEAVAEKLEGDGLRVKRDKNEAILWLEWRDRQGKVETTKRKALQNRISRYRHPK